MWKLLQLLVQRPKSSVVGLVFSQLLFMLLNQCFVFKVMLGNRNHKSCCNILCVWACPYKFLKWKTKLWGYACCLRGCESEGNKSSLLKTCCVFSWLSSSCILFFSEILFSVKSILNILYQS